MGLVHVVAATRLRVRVVTFGSGSVVISSNVAGGEKLARVSVVILSRRACFLTQEGMAGFVRVTLAFGPARLS